MSDATKAALDEEARAWAAEHADEAPPPPPAAAPQNPEHRDHQQTQAAPPKPTPAADDQADDEGPSEHALDDVELAAFGVGLIDAGLQNFVSPRCAFKPHQKAELAQLGSKVIAKYLPMLGGAVEPEYAFVGAVALFAFNNYQSSEPAQKPGASPAGGGNGPSDGSGVETEAKVDGRSVNAQVLQ